MGGAHSTFVEIEKKHGNAGVDYIVRRRNERIAYEQTRDELKRINDHVDLQESQDIEWIHQEKRQLEAALQQATQEAEAHKKGLINESEAKHKKSVRQFSGYNEEVKKFQELEKRVRRQYKTEKEKVSDKVDREISKGSAIGALKSLPEYDEKSGNSKKSIEDECIRKYPSKATSVNTVDIERNLKWDNFKDSFLAILNKAAVGKQNEEARHRIKGNVVPAQAPVCC